MANRKARYRKQTLLLIAALFPVACSDVSEPVLARAQTACQYQVLGTTVPNTSGSPVVINQQTGTVISANFFASGAIDPIDGQEYVTVCVNPPDSTGHITATIAADIGLDDDTQIKGYPQFLIGTKFGNQFETSFRFYNNAGLPPSQQWPVVSTGTSLSGSPYQLANLEYVSVTKRVGLPAFTNDLPEIDVTLDIDEFNVAGAERDLMLESWFFDTAANSNKLGLNRATGKPIANSLNNIIGIGHPHYAELNNTLLELMVHIGPLSPNDISGARRNPGQNQLTENYSGKDFDGDGIDDHFDVDSHINANNSQEPRPGIYSSGVDSNGDGVDDADILPVTIGQFKYSIWYGTSYLAPIVIFSRETNASQLNDFDPLSPDMNLSEEGEFTLHWNDFLNYTLYQLEPQLKYAEVPWATGDDNPFPRMRASGGAISGFELGIEPQTNSPDDLPYTAVLNKFDLRINGRTLGLVDGIRPKIDTRFPIDSSKLTPTTVDVTGTATDDSSGVSRVLALIQNTVDGVDSYWNGNNWQPSSFWNEAVLNDTAWSVKNVHLASNGLYRIHTRGYDLAGNHTVANTNSTTSFIVESEPPAIESPLQTIEGPNTTFTWANNQTDVSHYWLYLGTSIGGKDIYDSKNLGPINSASIVGIPGHINTIYARLWYKVSNSAIWRYIDSEYSNSTPDHYITNKNNNDPLSPFNDTFEWNSGADHYWLYAGSSIGAADYYDSGNLGTRTSDTVRNLPIDGQSTVYIRLWFRQSSEPWGFTDHTYVSGHANNPGISISPTASELSINSSQRFSWQAENPQIIQWWFYAGTSEGARDLSDSGNLRSSTEYIVHNIPDSLDKIYIRLWYRDPLQNIWKSVDRQYELASQ